MPTSATHTERQEHHTKLSTPVYYVDLTLRDETNLKNAISLVKQIDKQSRAVGFYQQALDHVARQGYGDARFEVNSEEELDLVEEFYTDELVEVEQVQTDSKARTKSKPKFNQGMGLFRIFSKDCSRV